VKRGGVLQGGSTGISCEVLGERGAARAEGNNIYIRPRVAKIGLGNKGSEGFARNISDRLTGWGGAEGAEGMSLQIILDVKRENDGGSQL